MTTHNEDMALAALVNAWREHSPDVPESLLRKAYEIQVNRQFEKDRDISLREMKRLVEDYLGLQADSGDHA